MQHWPGRKHEAADAFICCPQQNGWVWFTWRYTKVWERESSYCKRHYSSKKVDPLDAHSFVLALKEDAYCHVLSEDAEAPDISYFHRKINILFKHVSLDGAIQNFVQFSLQLRVLACEHDTVIRGQPEKDRCTAQAKSPITSHTRLVTFVFT